MNKYNETLIKILKNSEKEAKDLNHQYIGTEHFILSTLKINNPIKDKPKKTRFSPSQQSGSEIHCFFYYIEGSSLPQP